MGLFMLGTRRFAPTYFDTIFGNITTLWYCNIKYHVCKALGLGLILKNDLTLVSLSF